MYNCIKSKLNDDREWNKFCDTLFSHLPDVQSIMTARHTALALLNGKCPSFTIPQEEMTIITLNEELSKSSEVLCNSVSVLYYYQRLLPSSLANVTLTKLVTELYSHSSNRMEKPVLLVCLQIISQAPVDLLCNSIKGEFLHCMISLLQYDTLCNETIKGLVKCLRTYPHLYNYEKELTLIIRLFGRHLYRLIPLYSKEERNALKEYILLAISDVVQKSCPSWFDLNEQEKSNNKVCPLLVSLFNVFTRSPKVSQCILLCHVIMCGINCSSCPVEMASHFLVKFEEIQNKDNASSCGKYLSLLCLYLEVWSNSEKQTELTSFDEDSCDIPTVSEVKEDDPVLLRDYVLNKLVLYPDEAIQLSTTSSCYGDVTIALLEALPIPVYLGSELEELDVDQSFMEYNIEDTMNTEQHIDVKEECCYDVKNMTVIELLTNYKATLGDKDISVLQSLFGYEEGTSKSLLSSYNPLLWGQESAQVYKEREGKNWLLWEQPKVQNVMSLLSEKTVLNSSKCFPFDRLLEPIELLDDGDEHSRDMYDPCFILPLIYSLLSSDLTVNDCHLLIRRGLLCYTIKATSSSCPNMRRAAYQILALFKELLPSWNFREKPQMIIFMEVFSNSVPENNTRLPVIISAFFSKVCQLFLHPEHVLFPIVSDFLLERPLVDIRKIPLFDSLLWSPHYKERQWMIELLQEGLVKATPTDYQLYKKSGVFTDLKICHMSPLIGYDSILNDIVTSL